LRKDRGHPLELLGGHHQAAELGLVNDALQVGGVQARLERYRDRPQIEAGQVGHHPVDVPKTADADELPFARETRAQETAGTRLHARPDLRVRDGPKPGGAVPAPSPARGGALSETPKP